MTAGIGGADGSAFRGAPQATALLLGQVGVGIGERFLAPRSTLSRVLLAVLALDCGRVVGDEALIRAAWGDRPPDSRSAVAVAVHRLRQWLREHVGESAELARTPSGYSLSFDGGNDVERFHSLVSSVSNMDAGETVATLEEALRCWRGPALFDLPGGCPAMESADRLNREKLIATLDLSAALMRIGKARRATELLEPLAASNPLDEPVYGAFVEALAACGRQAEALEAYQRIRDSLADELGVDPGQQLQQVYLRVLRQQVPSGPMVDPFVSTVPSQLPNDLAGFTGRLRHLSELHVLLADRPDPTAATICSIVGTAGVGKTESGI